MPDALELPRVVRVVVPLVRAGLALVLELVADGLPVLAAIVGAVDHLAEPIARLRGIDPVGIDRRPHDVVNLPPPEVRTADVPTLALSVRRQDEGALMCTDEHTYAAHTFVLLEVFCGQRMILRLPISLVRCCTSPPRGRTQVRA